MKKIFLALAVLATLTFSVASSRALVSMPDAVPGKHILLPFFLSGIDSGESTLLVIQNVTGTALTQLDVNLYDIDSVLQYNTTTTLTGYDVAPFSVRDDWIAKTSVETKAALEIDLDGDGTNDHYAGYVEIVNQNSDASVLLNAMMSWIYQIDLANGIASGALAVSEELEGNLTSSSGMVDSSHIEVFSAEALVAAKEKLALGTTAQTATSFSMYPRYFVYNANSENYLFSWRDTTTERTYYVDFYDVDETAISSRVTLTHELDILDVRDIVPAGHMTSYPYAGWINFIQSDSTGGTGTFTPSDEWIMYNYQKAASSSASSNWSVLFDVHRDAGT